MARTWAADNRITEEPGHVKMKRLVDEWKAQQLASKIDENRWPKDERPADAPKAPETAPQKRRGRPSKRAG